MEQKYHNLLRIHDACRGLTSEEIESLAEEAEVIHAETGDLVQSSDRPVDSLLIVVQGVLKVILERPGGRQKTLRYVSAGDQFGALILAGEEEVPLDVLVEERAVLLKLRRETVFALAERFPTFRRNMLRKVGCGVRDLVLPRQGRKMPKIVAFISPSQETTNLIAKFASQLTCVGEQLGVLCDAKGRVAYDPSILVKSLDQPDGDILDQQEIRLTLGEWTDISRIFIVLDRTLPVDQLAGPIDIADALYCLSATDDFEPTLNLLATLQAQAPSWKKKTRFVWVLRDDEKVAPLAPRLSDLSDRDFKVGLLDGDTERKLYTQGIDRVIHDLRGISIGLALSGGAAHGMAHLGVLKAFEEEGIIIDRIAGTSAGVLTGVLYCAGYSPDWCIHQFPQDLEPGSIYKKLPKGEGFYMLAQYRKHSWNPMLRSYLGDWRLEQCPIPVSTVTTDLVSASAVVRTTGDAVDSILESINLPILSPPICRDGQLLVDGGILNNLPADVLIRQGCNVVIGVDVAAHIERRMGDNFPGTPTERMKEPGIVSTLLRCFKVQAHNLSKVGAQPADITITPDVSMFDATSFTRTPEMALIAHTTTMEAMPQIRDILQHLDGELFAYKAASRFAP